jgi:hypothetical protein
LQKNRKSPSHGQRGWGNYFPRVGSLAFDDFAGLDAAGADAHTLAYTVHLGLDGLQIDVPAAPSGVVGVRDVVTELRAFAAKIAFCCHGDSPILNRRTPAKQAFRQII